MDPDKIRNALRNIGLALNACHNTVATDVPETCTMLEKEKGFWRIDNSLEIAAINELEGYFKNMGIVP